MALENIRAYHAKTRVFSGDYCIDTHPEACHHLAMSRSKEQFIEATGGYRLGLFSSQEQVEALRKKLLSGVPAKEREDILEEMRRLQGIPSPEWDYEPND